MKKNFMHRIKGFTMVEVITVMAAMSVAMAIAIPAFGEFSDKAGDYSFTSQCNNIKATASVMAKNDYMLRGEDSERLCRELNEKIAENNSEQDFERYIVENLFVQDGKILQMKITRGKDNRMVYYTDDLQFVDERPDGFKTEYTVYNPEVTEKYIPEKYRYTATTPAAVTTVTTVNTTVTTVNTTTPAVTTAVTTTVTEAPVTTAVTTTVTEITTAVSSAPVNAETTVSETMKYDTEFIRARSVPLPSYNGKYEFEVYYSLKDLGYDWRKLEGIGVKVGKGPWGGNQGCRIVLPGCDVTLTDFVNDYAELRINQNAQNIIPDSVIFYGYNAGELEDVIFYFNDDPAEDDFTEEIESGKKTEIKLKDGKYDFSSLSDKNFISLTIEFADYTTFRNGAVVFGNWESSASFEMKRENGKSVTIFVNPSNTFFTVNVYYDSDNKMEIEHVYVNY